MIMNMKKEEEKEEEEEKQTDKKYDKLEAPKKTSEDTIEKFYEFILTKDRNTNEELFKKHFSYQLQS